MLLFYHLLQLLSCLGRFLIDTSCIRDMTVFIIYGRTVTLL